MKIVCVNVAMLLFIFYINKIDFFFKYLLMSEEGFWGEKF